MGAGSATKGFLWKTAEQLCLIGCQFLLQIVLARLICPEAYGIVAIAAIFVSFSNVIIQCGLSTALVQKEKIGETEISSLFNFSIICGAGLYIALFFLAAPIARFFSMPELTSLLRVMMLAIFPGLLNSVQNALIRRRIDFKKNFNCSLISMFAGGTCGIWSALLGHGAWALAWQQLVYALTLSVSLTLATRWIPRLTLQFRKISSLLSYGWKVLVSNLVDDFVYNLRNFAIGKKFNSADLAFFNRGRSFPDLFLRSINGSLEAVLLPVLSRRQSDSAGMTEVLRSSITLSTFIVFPLLTFLGVAAPLYIPLLLTAKWAPSVFYLQVFCVYFAAWPVTTSNRMALYAKGLNGLVLKLDIVRKGLDVAVLFISMIWGMKGIAYGVAFVSLVSIFIYLAPAKLHLHYAFRKQIKDTLPNLMLAIAVGIPIYFMSKLPVSGWVLLILQFLTGGGAYLFLAWLLHMKGLSLCGHYLHSLIRRNSSSLPM